MVYYIAMYTCLKGRGARNCLTFLFPVALVSNNLYESFTNPTPHSFVTLSSTTKLGLGLPNKVMSTCVLSKLELDES